jgi:AcrR family transcriptional regulator
MPARSPRDRRSRILEAALRCFARRGVAATSVEEVLRASRSSIGSLYHFFGGKEGLAGAVYVEGLRRYHESLEARLSRLREPEACVRAVVAHYVAWVTRHPDWARFLLEHRRSSHVASVEREIRAVTREAFAAFEARLSPWVHEGRIAKLPPELYASILIGPAQVLAAHWLAQGRHDELRAAAPALAEAAWRALRRDLD